MIKVNKLNKIYSNTGIHVHALKNVSFNIKKGEYVAIMGPSGSGKSTMMNIIGCLDKPTDGDYILNGINIAVLAEEKLSGVRNKEIGFIFQSFNLLPRLSAIENIEIPMMYAGMGNKDRRERAIFLMEKVGLGNRIHHKPNELSGGQKQRVAIARALANNPAILLADEPTGNLDSSSEKEILNLFGELNNEGMTIIVVTHENEVAEAAGRILRFRDGELIDGGK